MSLDIVLHIARLVLLIELFRSFGVMIRGSVMDIPNTFELMGQTINEETENGRTFC